MSFNRTRALNLLNRIESENGDENGMNRISKHLSNAAKSTKNDWYIAFKRLAQMARDIGNGKIGEEILSGNYSSIPFSIFALKGNSKLPFVAFSTLPLYTCPGAGACKEWCYSLKAWRYPFAFARQLQNTLLLRHCPNAIKDSFMGLPKNITLRLYVDGDFESIEQVMFWWELLESRSDISGYGYSKSWDILREAYDRLGYCPDNYKLNLSSGGSKQNTPENHMKALPFVRGSFIAVKIDQSLMIKTRFALPEYHAAVRQAVREETGRAGFSCPGECGGCDIGGKQACGTSKQSFQGVAIAIGIH